MLELFPINPKKLIVIPLGSSSAHMKKTTLSSQECKIELELPINNKLIMLIGNLVAYKGIDLFIEIAKLYLRNHQDAVFFIAGKCESQQNKLNLTNVSNKYIGEFIFRDGYLDEDSIILAYKAADIGLLTFTRITTSTSLETYLYYCIPTLTSDIGPLREIGEQFLWYEKSKKASLVSKIKRHYIE